MRSETIVGSIFLSSVAIQAGSRHKIFGITRTAALYVDVAGAMPLSVRWHLKIRIMQPIPPELPKVLLQYVGDA